jgi:hypothetical protein
MKSEILSIENRNRAATDFNLSVKKNSSSHDPNAPDQNFEDEENLGNIYNPDIRSSVMSRPKANNGHGTMEVQIFFFKARRSRGPGHRKNFWYGTRLRQNSNVGVLLLVPLRFWP